MNTTTELNSLVFNGVSLSHRGIYTCFANNTVGYVESAPASLTIGLDFSHSNITFLGHELVLEVCERILLVRLMDVEFVVCITLFKASPDLYLCVHFT